VPVGLRDVSAIAAGVNHSLALKKDGTVVAWGNNDYGQSTVPAGLRNVRAIAAGDGYSMALKQYGIVVAWGRQSTGTTMASDVAAASNLAVTVTETDTLAQSPNLTVTNVTAPSAQGGQLFLPLIAHTAAVESSDSGVQGVAVVTTTTAAAVNTSVLTSTQPLSPLETSVTTTQVVTENIPISVPVTALASTVVTATPTITTTQVVTENIPISVPVTALASTVITATPTITTTQDVTSADATGQNKAFPKK